MDARRKTTQTQESKTRERTRKRKEFHTPASPEISRGPDFLKREPGGGIRAEETPPLAPSRCLHATEEQTRAQRSEKVTFGWKEQFL